MGFWNRRNSDENSIALSLFITNTLAEISKGIRDAQELNGHGAIVNPANLNWSSTKQSFFVVKKEPGKEGDGGPHVAVVEFDLLLTHESRSSSTVGAAGGGDIQVLKASLSSGREKENAIVTANRIKFSVPVLFPSVYYEVPNQKSDKNDSSQN